jgi:hypothetical protein
MKLVRISAIVAFALATLVGLTPTRADLHTCELSLDALRTVTEGAESLSDKDRAALLSKVASATVKVNQAKFCDALDKLNDYKAKVNDLLNARKPKISAEDAAALLSLVDDAIECVTELACNSASPCCPGL